VAEAGLYRRRYKGLEEAALGGADRGAGPLLCRGQQVIVVLGVGLMPVSSFAVSEKETIFRRFASPLLPQKNRKSLTVSS
jgi:hypothetical protein